MKKDRMQRDHMARELGRKSVGTVIGALWMNPGSASYLAAKRKLRKFYKDRDEHLRHPKYEKVISGTHTLLPILLPLLLLLVIMLLFIVSST